MPIRRRSAAPLPDPTARGRRIALNVILVAAMVDGVFLVMAALIAVTNPHGGALRIVGPLYGFGYIYLLYLTSTGAVRGRWGWWYTGLVAVTLGPPGAVIGARRLLAETETEGKGSSRPGAPKPGSPRPGRGGTPAAEAALPQPTRKERRKAATEQRRSGGR